MTDILANLFTIYKAASSKCKVLDEKFPSKFYESNPKKIYDSYYKFIEKKSNSEGEIEDEEVMELTTIAEKFERNEYILEKNGCYKLFHDINLVCTMLVHYYQPGTRNYLMVDKFYKFATELLLRECYALGQDLLQDKTNEVIDKERSELDKVISKDFIKISTNYTVPVAETYHIKTKDSDLFSSIIAKSELDHRPQELPNSNFEINKLLPQTNMFEEAPRLGFVAANTSNIPDPTLPPTEILTRFLHPNWYALPTTVWLQYGDYSSWAPAFNENGTVIDSTSRGIIWLKKIGYTELFKNDGEHGQEKIIETEESNLQENEKQEDTNNGNISNGDKENKIYDSQSTVTAEEIDVNFENIFNWTPSSYIDEDEIEAFKNGTQSELVTKSLLNIQELRRERVRNKIQKPSSEETRLYRKVKRVLKEVITSKQVSSLPFKPIREFPVLQANYNGSIPVVRAHPGRKRKYKK